MTFNIKKLEGRLIREVWDDGDMIIMRLGNTNSLPPADLYVKTKDIAMIETFLDREPSAIVQKGDGTWQKRIEQGQCPRCQCKTHKIERANATHCSICGLIVGER
tara:strand:+ start:347 stop:661 length:315 start_codon:yes stop_codon:yes gene_type:complete